MAKQRHVVGIVPARGGSKAIPRKNLALCAGKPLIAHTIDAARGASTLSAVLVSTDDDEIAGVARGLGADVPFLRPAALAQDDTPMLAVLQHALDWMIGQGGRPDALVLLQPTSPLRQSRHIDAAVKLFFQHQASSVVSVVEIPHHFNPLSVMRLEDGLLRPFFEQPIPTRRQDKPPAYARNGPAVLVTDPAIIAAGELYGRRCVPFFMDAQESIDIDSPHDLAMVERILSSAQ